MPPIALTIAGSDPSGGAGIQADLKTFHQFGVYGEAVVTLITVQNTRAVTRIELLAPDLVRQQIEAVLSDIPPHAAKTGALGSIEVVEAVADLAKSFSFPLVVDPVLVSKHGSRLLSPEAEDVLKRKLLPCAYLLTPNIPEAEALTGTPVSDEAGMRESAKRLLDLGCKAVLIKGGHRSGSPLDVLAHSNSISLFDGKRVDTKHTHGTGCTYSAAITAGLALGHDLEEAVRRAKSYVQAAIETAPGLGSGQGPVNHFAPVT
ncbi:MAG TPA: bifunctional hydroxymethylpyrimidine kinase/phosphomethylpyrimidine kinase [Bryobacteraceae bacterium]|nr:bifunctional hydroxymethylpyrimidine kinase/phosphomethylpyrimidine kinase [Bryobacteraceae bacterium]